MSTIPGGDEPREDQTNPDQPTPAAPEPPTPPTPEPPTPSEPSPAEPVVPPAEPVVPSVEPVVPPAEPVVPPAEPEPPAGDASAEPPPAESPEPDAGTYPPPGAYLTPGAYPPPASYPPPGSYPSGASSYPPPGYQQAPPPGYQAPPPGYQQAPPPPGYGYQQAPPPGYQQPPAGYAPGMPQPSLFGVALSDGWHAFTRAGWVFVGAVLVWFVIGLAVLAVISAIFGGPSRISSASGSGLRAFTGASFSASTFVLGIVAAIITGLIQAVFVRVALSVTRGHRPVFGEFFRFENVGPVAVLVLIIGVVEGVLRAIPVIGGLVGIVVQFFLIFAYYVLIDRGAQPVDAIRGSVELVTRNAGQTVVFYILAAVIILVGALLCGVGLLVAVPWVLLATAYLYRRLSGEQPQLPA